MTIKEYQELAMRTNDGKCTERLVNTVCVTNDCMIINIGELLNASLGLSGEVGELNDMIKKFIFHGHDLIKSEVKKELGDILWYVVLMCSAFGFDLEEIMNMNIAKLMIRYPEGFDIQKSIHREEGK